MNKDVIYIEPEDDITDIITKIENAAEKIVALVPPKKTAVLRSIVNIKLIAKAGAAAEKKIVLVTTDPSIIKLAAAVKLPVTKNLQTAPVVPKLEEAEPATVKEAVMEGTEADDDADGEAADGADVKADEAKAVSFAESGEKPLDLDVENGSDKDENAEKTDEKSGKSDKKDKKVAKAEKKAAKEAAKKEKSGKTSGNPVVAWIQEHKKVVIGCGVGAVALILVLVWMFAIAPAVTVEVGVRTTTTNFSENVTFTSNLAEENTSEGKFYLEEKKLETKTEVAFEATGKKNVGEKASGEVVVYAYFDTYGTKVIAKGDIFTLNGELSYVAVQGLELTWNGRMGDCENFDPDTTVNDGSHFQCRLSGSVPVIAEASGTKYNVPADGNVSDWTTTADVWAYSTKSIEGGTDETITVVQQSDIDAAKAKLETSNEAVNKQKLLDTISDSAFVIESSFKQTVGDAIASPGVGEEVKDNAKAKLTVTTTDTIYVIDSTKVEEFIREKAKLAENYKIYELNDPFIENFTNTDNGYVAKLKTSYVSGPKITESDVVEIIRGKGIGTARQDLEKAFDGISKIVIDGNFPWVSSVPGDNNKITVNISVEEK